MNKNDSAPTASSPSCSAETKWRTPRTLTSDDQIVERIRKYQMELKNMVQQSQSEDGSNVATASTSQLKPPSSSTITTTTTTKPFLEENPVGDHKSVTNETEDVIEVVCISDESDTEIDVVSVNEKNGQDGVDIQRDASSLCNSEADNNDYVEIVDDLDLRLSPTDFPSPCLSPSNELIGGDVNDNQDIVEMKSDSLAVKTCAETAIGTCDSAVGGKAEHPVHSQDLSRRMSPYSSSKSFTPIYTNDDLSSAAPARKRLKCDANVVNDASDDESLHSVVGCSSPMSLENPHTIFYVPTIHYGDEFTIAREPSCIKNLQGTVNTIVTSLIFDNRTVDHQSSDEAVNAEEYSLTNVETSPDIEFIKYKMNKKKKKKKKKKKSKRKEKRERLNDAEKLKSRHSSKKHKRRRRRHFENENLDDSDRYVFQQSYLNRPFVGGGTDTPTESRNSNS